MLKLNLNLVLKFKSAQGKLWFNQNTSMLGRTPSVFHFVDISIVYSARKMSVVLSEILRTGNA